MGDSFTDIPVFQSVNYSITTNNSHLCKKFVNYSIALQWLRSLAVACEHILKNFLKISIRSLIEI